MKERLDRRSAIKAISGLTAANIFLWLFNLYPEENIVVYKYLFSYLRGERPREGSPLADLEKGIEVTPSFEKMGIKVNKSAFVLAAAVVAMDKDPQMGIYNLTSFLRKFPLRLVAEKQNRTVVHKSGDVEIPYATYYPLCSLGPKIVFYPAYLRNYRRGLEEVNPQVQLENDATIYHEFTHLVQDAENPRTFPSRYNGNHASSSEYYQNPMEIEAFQTSWYLVRQEVEAAIRNNLSYWPLGRFFEFSE